MPLSSYIYDNYTGSPMRIACHKLYEDISYMFKAGARQVKYIDDEPPSWDNVIKVMEDVAWTL